MKFDAEKTVPQITGKKNILRMRDVRSFDYELRWKLCKMMKQIDKDVNFFSLRPLNHEFLNFIDGERSFSDIANAVGYEYNLKIKGEHILMFLLHLKEEGYLSFKIQNIRKNKKLDDE